MSTNTQPRQSKGTPVGGQFAGKSNPEGGVDLMAIPHGEVPFDDTLEYKLTPAGDLAEGDRLFTPRFASAYQQAPDGPRWTGGVFQSGHYFRVTGVRNEEVTYTDEHTGEQFLREIPSDAKVYRATRSQPASNQISSSNTEGGA